MAKGLSFNIDKNAKSNCICLFIALGIIGLLTMKGQNECRGQNSYAVNKKTNAVTGFMMKYMEPCDAPTAPRFKAPNAEIARLVGEDPSKLRVYYRYAQPQVHSPARYSNR